MLVPDSIDQNSRGMVRLHFCTHPLLCLVFTKRPAPAAIIISHGILHASRQTLMQSSSGALSRVDDKANNYVCSTAGAGSIGKSHGHVIIFDHGDVDVPLPAVF